FDHNDPRYFHTLCMGAQVTTAARYVAIFSLVWTVLRTLTEILWQTWNGATIVITVIDFACVVSLLLGTIKDKRILIIPYLLDQ
ncbi:hypothetical protein PMAYCL1PPCAC_05101, partial [Pristionchus mayeri]